jgi:hypothetical protein
MTKVAREQGQADANKPIAEMNLEEIIGFAPVHPQHHQS